MFSPNVLDKIGSVCGLLRTEPVKAYIPEVRMTFSPCSRNSLERKSGFNVHSLKQCREESRILIEAYPNRIRCKLQQYYIYILPLTAPETVFVHLLLALQARPLYSLALVHPLSFWRPRVRRLCFFFLLKGCAFLYPLIHNFRL
jgi:hypothetical protein